VVGIQDIPVISPPVEPNDGDTFFYSAYNNEWYYSSPWEIPDGQDLTFEGPYGYSPVGLSWLASDTLAVGDGTPGDVSGAMAMTGLILFGAATYDAPYGYDYDPDYGSPYDQYYTTLYSGATQNWSMILPSGPGLNGQFLKTDGTGRTSWATVSSGSLAWSALTGDLTETQVIPWDGPIVGTSDTSLSRISTGLIGVGIGVQGSFAGGLQTAYQGIGPTSTPGQWDTILSQGPASGAALLDLSQAINTTPTDNFFGGLVIGLDCTVNTALYPIYVEANVPATYAGNMDEITGITMAIDYRGSGSVSFIQTAQLQATIEGNASFSAVFGVYSINQQQGTGTIGRSNAVAGVCLQGGAGITTLQQAGYFQSGATAGTVTNDYSIVIAEPGFGGTYTNPHVGLFIEDQNRGGQLSGMIAIQTVGTPPSIFGGPITSPTVNATTYMLSDFGSVPTSTSGGGTAGTVGQLVQHSGVLYFCSVTGVAGSATWNIITMTLSA
jgi:hypothetical protein